MIGTVLSDRYRLEAKLGSGGMSTVYLARDETLDRPVAVKVMHREMSEQADQLQRFRQEARAVAKISHPNVVAVIDAGEDGGHPYIVFEYVEGETLKQRIARVGAPRRPGGPRLLDRGRPGAGPRPRTAARPPRRQAPERADRRRGAGEADRLRDLAPARAGRPHGDRQGAGDDRLRRARAGDGPRGRPPLRHLLARGRPLRDADRRGAVQRRQPGRGRDEARQRGAARCPAAPAGDLGCGRAGRRTGDLQGSGAPLPEHRRDDRRPRDGSRGGGRPGGLDQRRGDQRPRCGATARVGGWPAASAGRGRRSGCCWCWQQSSWRSYTGSPAAGSAGAGPARAVAPAAG